MIDDFVKSKILKHGKKWGLDFSDKQLNEIVDCVKEGVYAFQLIYNENHEVILVEALDWTKVIQNRSSDRHWGQNLWSYDGGNRFQYSLIETLKLDIQKLRELKLNQIL
jgi:hypothetical protein